MSPFTDTAGDSACGSWHTDLPSFFRGPYFGGLDPKFVRERVMEAHKLGSLCGAAIFDLGPINSESRKEFGLPSGHAYTLTDSTSDKVEVRNPWGEKTEWLGQTSAPDGEFWMEWDHFFTHFHQVCWKLYAGQYRRYIRVVGLGRCKWRTTPWTQRCGSRAPPPATTG